MQRRHAEVIETTETSQVIEGEEVHEELSERTPLQESANPKMEAECIPKKKFCLLRGKGPFDETGLDVGVKEKPADE